jgi:HAD superfamily hydrolase (TIGR01509 family)
MANRKIKGFIFDMDGTLTDNMNFHLPVWERVVAEMGGTLSGEMLLKELYGKNEDIITRIFGADKFTLEEAMYWGEFKEAKYREVYKGKIKPLPGLLSFLEAAKNSGIKLGLGTAGTAENIEFNLHEMNIGQYFDAKIGREQVNFSKPHPETFLICAEQMGLEPEACLVFEDVPKGVQTATAAGMQSVVLTTTHQREEFDMSHPIIHFMSDFADCAPTDFL